MSASDDSQPPAWDDDGSEDLEEDQGEELEALIEQADRPFALEDFDAPDDEKEMVGQGALEHDHAVAPEEAAMTVRDTAPRAANHPDDDDVEPHDESSEEA
jgi:hypothetical protein